MGEIRIVDGDVDLRGLVRELALVNQDGGSTGQVLSMYVDVDPRRLVSEGAREGAITSAIDAAVREAPGTEWRAALDGARTALSGRESNMDGTRGMLVYATQDGDATLVKLPWPVEQEIAFDHGVHVRQLVRSLPTSSWCVLLCNRRTARVLLGDRDHLEQVDTVVDEVDGQHDQGGWSQARFARNIERQVDEHLHHAVDLVEDLRRSGAFDCLLVAAPSELRPDLESCMPDPMQRCMCGWLDIDVEHSTVAEVQAIAAESIRTFDDARLERTLDRLRQNAGRRERAVIGLEEALAALCEQRVETLVVNDGFGHPGMVCPHGDWLAVDGGTCPTHDTRLQPCADVVELAIEHAIRQSAHVTIVERDDPGAPPADDGTQPEREAFMAMRSLGGISAIVRFDLHDRRGLELSRT